jgi:hypothetical protein
MRFWMLVTAHTSKKRGLRRRARFGQFLTGLAQEDRDNQPQAVVDGVGKNGQREADEWRAHAHPTTGRLSCVAKKCAENSGKHRVATQAEKCEARSKLKPPGPSWQGNDQKCFWLEGTSLSAKHARNSLDARIE